MGRAEPFHRMLAPERKLDPLAVSVKALPPAMAEFGDKLDSEGVTALMAKASALEIPPAGAGLKTVTEPAPAEAISEDEIDACSCVLLMNVVLRGLPFH